MPLSPNQPIKAPMQITICHRHEFGPASLAALERLSEQVGKVLKQGKAIMAQIDDLKAAVANETTVEQSAITLLGSLSAQLQAALNGGNPTADVQAVIDTMNANQTALAAAVTANTPAAAPPAAA